MPASSAADSAPACSRSTVVEVAVARRHGQPVGFPHDRHADDLRVDVEVGDHLPDQHQLLVILLAEERAIGPHDLQQLEHDGQHTREMRWAGAAFELRAQWPRVHGGALPSGYMSAAVGVNAISTPSARSAARSSSSVRG